MYINFKIRSLCEYLLEMRESGDLTRELYDDKIKYLSFREKEMLSECFQLMESETETLEESIANVTKPIASNYPTL